MAHYYRRPTTTSEMSMSSLCTAAKIKFWHHGCVFSARCNIYISRLSYDASVRLSVRLWRLCIVVTGCNGSRISLHAWIDGCLYYLLTTPHPDVGWGDAGISGGRGEGYGKIGHCSDITYITESLSVCILCFCFSYCIYVVLLSAQWGGSNRIEAQSLGPLFLQCFDTVGWVFWPIKPVPDITYNVFGGTLNLAQFNSSLDRKQLTVSFCLHMNDVDIYLIL